MMLNRFTGRETELYLQLPSVGELPYNNIVGIDPYKLHAYVKKHCSGGAKLLTAQSETLSSLSAALKKTHPKNPAIVILKGHYVFCEGSISSSADRFAVLDPKGGRCLVAHLLKNSTGTVKFKAQSGVDTFEATLEGLITTAPKLPQRKRIHS